MGNLLIITAILSLMGVSLAAILNYKSNIKSSRIKLQFEENKIKYSFYKESFLSLKEAFQKLQSMNVMISDASGEKYNNIISKYNKQGEDIFHDIKLYLSQEASEIINKQYIDAQEKINTIFLKNGVLNNSIPDQDKQAVFDAINNQTKIRVYLKNTIENELIILLKKMREFNFQ